MILALTIVTPYFAIFVGGGSAILAAVVLVVAFLQAPNRFPHRSILVAATAFLCFGALFFAYGMLRQNFAIIRISGVESRWIVIAIGLCWVSMLLGLSKTKQP
jgi:hypothetical protein